MTTAFYERDYITSGGVEVWQDGNPLSYDEDGPDDIDANRHAFTYRGSVYVPSGIRHVLMESVDSGIKYAVPVKNFGEHARPWTD